MKRRILVVDDQPDNIKVISEILTSDYKLFLANSGEQALEVIELEIPDLILLDIMMPGMDGYEVCRQLKNNPIYSHVPIIFLTAKTDEKAIVKGLEMGAVDYVTKPFLKKEIRVRVKNHIEAKLTKEELIKSNEDKDKLFSIIAHDLRSPIAGMMSLLEILSKDELSEEKKGFFIETLYSSSSYTYQILNNLLSWARLQIDSNEPEKEKIDFNLLFNDIKKALKSQYDKKDISLIIQEVNIYLYGDKVMLHSLFLNLLANAIKFTPKTGKIQVKAETQADDFIHVKIEDTGVGMDQKTIDKLFRVDAKFTSKGTEGERGTGLGLKIANEFIKKHNGSVQVHSEIGKGSTFIVKLPL